MKKIFLTIILSAVAVASQAQTMSDALQLGKDNYYGTARTLGMGNAVTAVGGDLGTIALNPAGSAVAGYSQFTISQGVTISSTTSSWAQGYSELDGSQFYSGAYSAGKSRYIVPNVGFNLRVETGESSGLKSWNFAFLSTMTNNFLEKSVSRGFNASGDDPSCYTSMAGSFATGAFFNSDGQGSMMDPYILTWADPYNSPNARGFYDRWQYIVAYQGGMINSGWTQASGDSYYGANEFKDGPFFDLDDNGNKIPLLDENNNPVTDENGDPVYIQHYDFSVPGRLNQVSKRLTAGSKNDITTNFGFNIDDSFYFGFNLHFPMVSLRYNEMFSESADISTWPAYAKVTPEMVLEDGTYDIAAAQYFDQCIYEYKYDADIAGIGAGVGFIWLPVRNLRIGASVRTPTAYSVDERLYMTVDTKYENLNRHASTPIGEFSYNFRSPWSANAGLAFTLGSFGLLSADYQMTDFSVMKYSIQDEFSAEDPYEEVNDIMSQFCGVSHMFRLGMEIRPLPFLSLRAGYNYTTDPECYYYDNKGSLADASFYGANYGAYRSGSRFLSGKRHYVKAPVKSVSLGAGYMSTGSFYADFALRRTESASYYSPYETYLECYDTASDQYYMVVSPSTRTVRHLVDAVLTLGWRF